MIIMIILKEVYSIKIPKDWQYFRADQFYKFGRKGLLFVWRIDGWISSTADKSDVKSGQTPEELKQKRGI